VEQRRTRPAGASLDDIEAVYRRRYADFARFATAILGDREAARDAVQDGFARAVRFRDTFRGEGSLEAWVCRSVLNAARDRRATMRRSASEVIPTDLVAGSVAEPDVRGDLIAHALGALSERQRLALFLHYYVDLDYRSIGEALGIRVGTVGATLNAARTSLRSLLKEVRP
jgi:RNA polymerase sigma-70 factor (ECF subfamily)